MQMPPPKSQEKLNDDQRELITETLSKYDSQALTEQDALAIVEVFEEGGIEPGREMVELVADSGFDAKELGDLAGVEGAQQGQRPPPPPSDMQAGSLNITDETMQNLNELMDKYLSEGISVEEKEATLTAMQAIFETTAPETGLINQYA